MAALSRPEFLPSPHPAGFSNPNLFFVFAVDASELPGFKAQVFAKKSNGVRSNDAHAWPEVSGRLTIQAANCAILHAWLGGGPWQDVLKQRMHRGSPAPRHG